MGFTYARRPLDSAISAVGEGPSVTARSAYERTETFFHVRRMPLIGQLLATRRVVDNFEIIPILV